MPFRLASSFIRKWSLDLSEIFETSPDFRTASLVQIRCKHPIRFSYLKSGGPWNFRICSSQAESLTYKVVWVAVNLCFIVPKKSRNVGIKDIFSFLGWKLSCRFHVVTSGVWRAFQVPFQGTSAGKYLVVEMQGFNKRWFWKELARFFRRELWPFFMLPRA